jgi:hypothetical protein
MRKPSIGLDEVAEEIGARPEEINLLPSDLALNALKGQRL